MNVIKVKNLKTPAPSSGDMWELRASLAALAGPDDPLTVSLCAENWPGRQAVHCVYYAGLRTLTELTQLDESKLGPLSWRFFAGGHKTAAAATGCMATYGRPGLPVRALAVTRGAAPAHILTSTELLNELNELGDNRDEYELRVLRIPGLGTEAFWLKSLSAQLGDLIIPYALPPGAPNLAQPGPKGTANGSQVYPVAEFLESVAGYARQRLAQPDIADLAHRPRVRMAPADLPKPSLLHSPGPDSW